MVLLLGIACGVPASALAQEACTAPGHRQFDFWLGDWEVVTGDGKVAGTNRIERAQGGCVVHEHYRTPRGYEGQSLNAYDAARDTWHQTWVDNTGTLLLLEGGVVDGNMVLSGETTRRDGSIARHRITWTPNEDGTVRQFWETTDATGTWKVAFDGLYRKAAGPHVAPP